jgi:predicted AAA+ superfamily ATPase
VKERFKRVVAERLSGSPPEALDRKVELPLAPNDYEGEEDGIKFVPLWRWLLE